MQASPGSPIAGMWLPRVTDKVLRVAFVTAQDLIRSADDVLGLLRSAEGKDWSAPATGLTWTCRETVEHMADSAFTIAGQLGPRPPVDDWVAFGWSRRRDNGLGSTIYGLDDASPDQLCQVVDSTTGMLAALVETRPASWRAYTAWGGESDPEGFCAMGVVELVVHLHDVSEPLGIDWKPDEDLCDRVLRRLSTDAPTGTPRWETLLWATGRGEIDGRERLTEWGWDGRPRV